VKGIVKQARAKTQKGKKKKVDSPLVHASTSLGRDYEGDMDDDNAKSNAEDVTIEPVQISRRGRGRPRK
jgi:hypothetical protein